MLALEVAYPKPTETLYSYTVLVLIHTCVTKVYSLSVCIMYGLHKDIGDLLTSSLFGKVWLHCLLSEFVRLAH